MFRHALSVALPVSLILLLAACGNGEPAKVAVRPAMVVQPQLAGDLMDAYPGEVRARLEPLGTIVTSSPQQFEAHIKQETAMLADVIRRANIKSE